MISRRQTGFPEQVRSSRIDVDTIVHTPCNEQARIKPGPAFDAVGGRRQVNFTVDAFGKTMTEEIEVKVRNQKKKDARTITCPVRIAAESETVARHIVTCNWQTRDSRTGLSVARSRPMMRINPVRNVSDYAFDGSKGIDELHICRGDQEQLDALVAGLANPAAVRSRLAPA